MEENVGDTDRIVRLVIGAVILVIGILLAVTGSALLGVVVILVSLYPLLTAILVWCPIYTLIGTSTHKE